MKIKFVTLNIFNGNFLAKSIDFLKKENPEIFVLQEVSRGGVEDGEKRYRSCEIIKSEFNDYFCFYTPENYKFINKIKVDSGNAVFSRFPILEQEFTYYSRQYSERKEENILSNVIILSKTGYLKKFDGIIGITYSGITSV